MLKENLNQIRLFSGLIVVGLVGIVSLICFVIYPDFGNDQAPVLSDFGALPKTDDLFNWSFVVSGLLVAIFFLTLIQSLELNDFNSLKLLTLIFGFSVALIGFIPTNLNGDLHQYVANVAAITFLTFLYRLSSVLHDRHITLKYFCRRYLRRIVSVYVVFGLWLNAMLFAELVGGLLMFYWISRVNYMILTYKESKKLTD